MFDNCYDKTFLTKQTQKLGFTVLVVQKFRDNRHKHYNVVQLEKVFRVSI
jgi:hypothetical protein